MTELDFPPLRDPRVALPLALFGLIACALAAIGAGVMLAGEGLQASSKGVRVRFGQGKGTVIDGPFTETKELIAGFWLWQVKSVSEAVEWIRRSPFKNGSEEIEIRRVFEAEDFGENMTPEIRAMEDGLRSRTTAKN